MKIRPVIHVSNLKLYHEGLARNQLTKGAVKTNSRSIREPEEILVEREVVVGRRCIIEFLVKWKNLGDDEMSWEIVNDLKKLLQKIEDHDTRLSRRR